ncbi:MAG: Hsp20/alpha crystallin family protein [Promethearchaeota archaeon]
MAMVESPSKDVQEKKEEKTKSLYRVTPRYSAWLGEGKFIVQVALPGVAKENVHIRALEDYFQLRAERDNIEYTLDLDLNFRIEPDKVTTNYVEGLLRVEFERYKPLEHAYDVPIN